MAGKGSGKEEITLTCLQLKFWPDCTTCYHFCHGCAYGYDPAQGCTHYAKRYHCPGGRVQDHPITRDECRECASTCAGCLEKAVEYGFVEYERVRHLLGRGAK